MWRQKLGIGKTKSVFTFKSRTCRSCWSVPASFHLTSWAAVSWRWFSTSTIPTRGNVLCWVWCKGERFCGLQAAQLLNTPLVEMVIPLPHLLVELLVGTEGNHSWWVLGQPEIYHSLKSTTSLSSGRFEGGTTPQKRSMLNSWSVMNKNMFFFFFFFFFFRLFAGSCPTASSLQSSVD